MYRTHNMKLLSTSPLTFAFLFGAVTARPISRGLNSSLALDLRQTPTTLTTAELTNLEFYVQYAAAAYCNAGTDLVGSKITCSSSACPSVEAQSVTNYAYLGFDQSEADGFVGIDSTNKQIIIAYEGTANLDNLIIDILFETSSCDLFSGCELHSGFQDAWEDVEDTTMAAVKAAVAEYPTYSVIKVSHSLGGAVATIAGPYLRAAGIPTDIYSYDSPRVGNEAFVDFVEAQANRNYRVTHYNNSIPRYPAKSFGYRHTSPEFWLSTGSATTTDYTLAEIEVGVGTENTDCNDWTDSLSLTAHSYCFQKVSACG